MPKETERKKKKPTKPKRLKLRQLRERVNTAGFHEDSTVTVRAVDMFGFEHHLTIKEVHVIVRDQGKPDHVELRV